MGVGANAAASAMATNSTGLGSSGGGGGVLSRRQGATLLGGNTGPATRVPPVLTSPGYRYSPLSPTNDQS